jgi:hydrogenase expression/formation protein HypE
MGPSLFTGSPISMRVGERPARPPRHGHHGGSGGAHVRDHDRERHRTLVPLVDALRAAIGEQLHVLRDPTRGGLASTLNEIASASEVGCVLDEESIPVPPEVAAACDMLGLDPLYVANEGVLAAIVPLESSDAALGALRSHPLGAAARAVGRVVAEHPGLVVLRTAIGGTRIVDLLPGDQLPRIC